MTDDLPADLPDPERFTLSTYTLQGRVNPRR